MGKYNRFFDVAAGASVSGLGYLAGTPLGSRTTYYLVMIRCFYEIGTLVKLFRGFYEKDEKSSM